MATGGRETIHELTLGRFEQRPRDPEGFLPVTAETSRGDVRLRLYPAARSRAGVVWMGGAGGGWDTPAHGLYPRLADELVAEGISSVRVRFRDPRDLAEAALDALVAAQLLAARGCDALAFVGHSFGGAVAIQAAAHLPIARTVVALASQSFGASPARGFDQEGKSLLILHGTADEVLPPACSETIDRMATGRKELVLLEGTRHGLDEAADEVTARVRAWLLRELAPHDRPTV